MDRNEALKIAKKYVYSVARKYQFENAILFGSFAKGTQHTDSDIDIAIIFSDVEDIIDLQAELMNLRSDDDLMIEPHPFKSSDFLPANPLVSEIIKDGVEIWK